MAGQSNVILLKDPIGRPLRLRFVEQILSFCSLTDIRRLAHLSNTWRTFIITAYEPLCLEIIETRDHALIYDTSWGREWLARVLPSARSVRLTGNSSLMTELCTAQNAPRLHLLFLCITGTRYLDISGVFPRLKYLYVCDPNDRVRSVTLQAPSLLLSVGPFRLLRMIPRANISPRSRMVAKVPTFQFYRWVTTSAPEVHDRHHYLSAADGLSICALPTFWRDYDIVRSRKQIVCSPNILARGLGPRRRHTSPEPLLTELSLRLGDEQAERRRQEAFQLWRLEPVAEYW